MQHNHYELAISRSNYLKKRFPIITRYPCSQALFYCPIPSVLPSSLLLSQRDPCLFEGDAGVFTRFDDVIRYDLVPLNRAAWSLFVSEVICEIKAVGFFALTNKSWSALKTITGSAKSGNGDWQFTTFDADGPSGDIQVDDIRLSEELSDLIQLGFCIPVTVRDADRYVVSAAITKASSI